MEKKGITIEINANITNLQKQLREVSKESRSIDRELKKVDKALKFNPTSVVLWRQKQELLTKQIKDTGDKLDLLKEKQRRMDAGEIEHTEDEYRNLQREIVETESRLKHFQKELKKVSNVKLKALGEQFKQVGEKMKTVGQNMTRYVTAPIAAGLAASVKAATSYGDAIAKVSTIADETEVPIANLKKGIMDLSNESGKGATELAEATYQALSASVDTKDAVDFVRQATGLAKAGFLETSGAVDVLTTIINAYGKSASEADEIANMLIQTQNDGKTTVDELAASMGNVIPTASALNVPLEQLSAAYVSLTKQGINTNRTTTAINAMLNELSKSGSGVAKILEKETGKSFGQLMADGYSLGDVLQILSNNVDGDKEAFKNLFGNVRAGQGALALLNGGIDEFNAETQKMVESTGNVDNALSDLSTEGAALRKALNLLVNVGIQVGDVLAPYIEKAAEIVQKLVEKFNSLSPETQKIIVLVGVLAAAIGPILTVIGTITSGVGSLLGVLGGISPMMLGIVAVVAVVVAAGIALYKNWDKVKAMAVNFANGVKNTFINLKNGIATTFNAIKTAIVTPIQSAINKVKSIIDKIKSFFPIKVGNLFGHIKLPHFDIGWKSLGSTKLKIPTFNGINWYAQGGIFDSPSVIGVGEGKSAEAVVPLDKFWSKLDKLQGETNIVININGANANPKEIAEEVKRALIREVRSQRLANGGI